MSATPEMRSPAPRANADVRAEVTDNDLPFIIAISEPKVDFTALFVARRYRLPWPLAKAVAALADLGRALG